MDRLRQMAKRLIVDLNKLYFFPRESDHDIMVTDVNIEQLWYATKEQRFAFVTAGGSELIETPSCA